MKKMFVAVDYQYDFVSGALGFPGAELLDEGIVQCGKEAEAEGAVIVETKDTHRDDYLQTREGKALSIPHTIYGTPGWDTYGKTGLWLKETPHIVIMKSTFGCPPDELLKLPDGVEEIEVVGLVTNMCVISNICCFQARYPNAQITVYENLCASFNKDLNDKTMDVLRGLQVNVVAYNKEV